MGAAQQRLHDLHCHLDFMSNAEEVALDAAACGSLIFANTVTPAGFEQARTRFAHSENVRLGLGLHPWYLDPASARQLELFEAFLPSTQFVGEVGLDFGKRQLPFADGQLDAFREIARWCAREGGKTLSIHAVKSAEAVLDMLAEAGTLSNCTCVFHWFSDANDQLHRAVKAGCYFSVGPFMANSRRGREYLKVIPANKLLFETDAPPTRSEDATIDPVTGEPRMPFAYSQLREWLEEASGIVAQIKGPDALEVIEETSRRVLGQ